MKQVFNKKGEIIIEEIPAPMISDDEILVQVYYSCISTGTELSNLKSSSRSLYRKVLDKPQNITKVLKWIKEKGITQTISRVKTKIENRNPLGYSASGIVLEVGKNIKRFKFGDRVACAGAGIANHAEFIDVPENLTVNVPEDLSLHLASTITLGGIALQGVRRCNPVLGELIVVAGLGILGQLTVQFLKLTGCRVIAIDIQQERIKKAISLGADYGFNPKDSDIVEEIINITGGHGADSVIITACSKDSTLIKQSMEMCRKKGKIVIVGDIGLNLDREQFYVKELDLLISTSYGPGRYDEKYELKGMEYPYAYIRWTENRNMQEYIKLLSEKRINAEPLISKIYPIEKAGDAFEDIKSGTQKPLISILEYSKDTKPERKILFNKKVIKEGKIKVGIIGTGQFTQEVHLPNLEKLNNIYDIHALCSKTGANIDLLGKKYGSYIITTDYREILKDKDIDMVIISTRHNLHAKIAIEAAKAGKAIYLEKPMALDNNDLSNLVGVLKDNQVPFTVGFNRRFSPLAIKIKEVIKKRIEPLIINYRFNAGFIPLDHWVHTEEGGGRNIGEACHIYDLFNFFIEDEVLLINAYSIDPKTDKYCSSDNFIANFKYKDGSVCNLIYTSLGNKDVPKEQMDIYFDGKTIFLDDYRELKIFDLNKKSFIKEGQDKGQYNELKSFGEGLKNNREDLIIPIWQITQATRTSFEVEKQIYK